MATLEGRARRSARAVFLQAKTARAERRALPTISRSNFAATSALIQTQAAGGWFVLLCFGVFWFVSP